ncbi:MAG: DNA polymerase III subunit epsilon [Azonexus sp.]
MRQIFLDTETTGLDPRQGHRIIEVACIEMENRRPTSHHLHKYINPEREIDAGAAAVHGITLDFLADKPKFADIADEFLEFINGAELIIHNAPFDIGFLNAELSRLDRVPVETLCKVTDTLRMAKDLHPGKRNSLDALCDRYEINNSQRTLHGALLDTELLAEVYLAMTRGQNALMIEPDDHQSRSILPNGETRKARKPLIVKHASEEEIAQHNQALAAINKESKGACLWLTMTEPAHSAP